MPHKQSPTLPRKRWFALLGPAFVASIAYVDPGNVASNLSAGAEYGYLLVWVLVLANLMAVLVQYLSAKLGVVTGQSLPDLLGQRMRRGPRLLFWGQAEIVAAATDLAEVVGGAIALHILFGLPLLWGGVLVGAVSMLLLATQNGRNPRRFEALVVGLLVVITIGFMAGLVVSPVDWTGVSEGLVPRFQDSQSVLLAASMLGATVMPHAIYLHSALVCDRHGSPRGRADGMTGRLLKATRWDVVLGLVLAGSVNIGMLLMAAASLPGVPGTDSIEGAATAISDHLGPVVGLVFALGLLASGLASTSVGCYAGSAIMKGLLHVQLPLLARRAITLIPALAVLAVGWDPTWSLVVSQVVLSLGIPFAIIPLAKFTADRQLMGQWVNPMVIRVFAVVVTAAIVVLNVLLVVLTFSGLA
nr:Nramp family divalent metal transporter [Kocuria sp. 36]